MELGCEVILRGGGTRYLMGEEVGGGKAEVRGNALMPETEAEAMLARRARLGFQSVPSSWTGIISPYSSDCSSGPQEL